MENVRQASCLRLFDSRNKGLAKSNFTSRRLVSRFRSVIILGNRVQGSSPPAERAGNKRFRLWFAPLSQSNLIRYVGHFL